MIRVAVCDDEQNIRDDLLSLVARQGVPCRRLSYPSAQACLAAAGEFDLLFLDVELGGPAGLNGMELARRLRSLDMERQPVIVFVTGHQRYVFDAFDVGAFQYLLKPVDEGKFGEVFSRAVEQLASREREQARHLVVQTGGVCRSVPLDSIRYIESSNHKVVLHLEEEALSCYGKIGELEKTLGEQFFRIHKGYLVNLGCVEGYSRTEVLVAGGERLMLSKYKYGEFVKTYLRFLKRGLADE